MERSAPFWHNISGKTLPKNHESLNNQTLKPKNLPVAYCICLYQQNFELLFRSPCTFRNKMHSTTFLCHYSLTFTSSHYIGQPTVTYHPLKGHAQNSTPPQLNNKLETAGTAYHLRPKSTNHLYLRNKYKIKWYDLLQLISWRWMT